MENDELARHGLRAYEFGEFPVAVDFLKTLLDREPKLWTCRLYLAMSYLRMGEDSHARQELNSINQYCTDQSVKKKALDALRSMNGFNESTQRTG
ncbi:MAG TPA: hypothetical protein V6D22_16715 [Candidatus Obscuribacterales bacterium]